jgi:PBP4 family serine-type D-alanyl-D-alanine carboxypeptidase
LLLLPLAILVGCASAPLREQSSNSIPSSSSYPALKEELDGLLVDSLFPPAHVGIKVFSLTNHEVLYALNAAHLFNPASNQKLFTSAAALALLGKDFQFATQFYLDSSDHPTLTIRGGGDPLMSSREIDSIAQLLRPFVQRRPLWTLHADLSLFDDRAWGKGWMWDDEPDPSAMVISPLSVNGNSISLSIMPGHHVGDPVQIETDPPTGFVLLENHALTVEDTTKDSVIVERKWADGWNQIIVSGTLAISDSGEEVEVSLRNPHEYFLTLLKERLTECGIESFDGGDVSMTEEGPPALTFVRDIRSVVTYLNKESDNLSSENLLKMIGAAKYGPPGTDEKGLRALKEFLSHSGIDTTSLVLADGSGVSRYNLCSPNAIVGLLVSAHRNAEIFPAFYESLPIAGRDGTLAKRMRNTRAEGNLRAKTGSLSGISSLSGYVHSAGRELLAFSIMMQNFPGGPMQYRAVQDRMGIALSNFRRSNF